MPTSSARQMPIVASPLASDSAVRLPSSRSYCPGSVASVETNLTGSPADALEQLQGKYENDPGFLAVVFDGTKPIVIVEATAVPVWEGRLGPTGIAVAPSCINPELLRAVYAVLPSLSRSSTAVSAGYNGLEDGIDVLGVDSETLISDLDKSDAAIGAAARVAVANGTLRIDPARLITAPGSPR